MVRAARLGGRLAAFDCGLGERASARRRCVDGAWGGSWGLVRFGRCAWLAGGFGLSCGVVWCGVVCCAVLLCGVWCGVVCGVWCGVL